MPGQGRWYGPRVDYDVRTETAAPRLLAAVSTTTTPQELGRAIIALLDQVWPVVRAQGVVAGHNVVIYDGRGAGSLQIHAGVEVTSEFAETGAVRRRETPAGEVATITHLGAYNEMTPTYTAMQDWLAAHGRRGAGPSWEVYGDPADDPAQTRTDIYVLLAPAQTT